MHTRREKADQFSLNPSSLTGGRCHEQSFRMINIKWPRVNHVSKCSSPSEQHSHPRTCCPWAGRKPPLLSRDTRALLNNVKPKQLSTPTVFTTPPHSIVGHQTVTMHFTRQIEDIKEPDCYRSRAISNSSVCKAQNKAS